MDNDFALLSTTALTALTLGPTERTVACPTIEPERIVLRPFREDDLADSRVLVARLPEGAEPEFCFLSYAPWDLNPEPAD